MNFKEITLKEIELKPFSKIADEWMLITAGNEEKFNTMTASWGFLGEMWAKPAAICVLRPQRYTLEFCEKEDFFTLSFFGDHHRKELAICGSKSGRDCDKIAETGLSPVFSENGVYFEEAELILFCKKMYVTDIDPKYFLNHSLCENIYPNEDYHKVFVAEVLKAFVKD